MKEDGENPGYPLFYHIQPPANAIKLASLLAVLLVAKSSRGDSIVYAYPPQPRAVARSTKPMYRNWEGHLSQLDTDDHFNFDSRPLKREDSDESQSDPDDSGESNSDYESESEAEELSSSKKKRSRVPPPAAPAKDETSYFEDYLGLPSATLASLLCPGRVLCDQPHEMVIDHLAFIGHPVWVGDENVYPDGPSRDELGQRHRDPSYKGRGHKRNDSRNSDSQDSDSQDSDSRESHSPPSQGSQSPPRSEKSIQLSDSENETGSGGHADHSSGTQSDASSREGSSGPNGSSRRGRRGRTRTRISVDYETFSEGENKENEGERAVTTENDGDGQGKNNGEGEIDSESPHNRPTGDSTSGQSSLPSKATQPTPIAILPGETSHLHLPASQQTGSGPFSSSGKGSLNMQNSLATQSPRTSVFSFSNDNSLLAFNFVCVIDTPPDSHLSSHLEGYYKDVIVPITANLKAIERNTRWLASQASHIFQERELNAEAGKSDIDLVLLLPRISKLAHAMQQVYSSVKTDKLASIHFGPLQVQVLLRGEIPLVNTYEDFGADGDADEGASAVDADEMPSGLSKRERAPPLFSRERKRPPVHFHPWQALLPLEDLDVLRHQAKRGTSIWHFLDTWNPTMTLSALKNHFSNTEGDLEDLDSIVQHMCHWGKGKIIDVVALRNTYGITAKFDHSRLAPLSIQFKRQFPKLLPLPVLLSKIDPTRPFSTCVDCSQMKSTYINVITWLLQHDVIEKQRAFIRLVAIPRIKTAAALNYGSVTSASQSSHEYTGLNPSGVSESSIDVSNSVKSSRSSEDLAMAHKAKTAALREATESMVIVGAGSERDIEGVSTSPPPVPGDAFDNSSFKSNRPSSIYSLGPPGKAGLTSMSYKQPSHFNPNPTSLSSSVPVSSGIFMRSLNRKNSSNRLIGISPIHSFTLERVFEASLSSSAARKPAITSGLNQPGPTITDNDLKITSIILDPDRPSMLERRWISEMCRNKDKTLVENFDKCVRMFNGSHQWEEIRFKSGLSREELRSVLEEFKEHIIVFRHP